MKKPTLIYGDNTCTNSRVKSSAGLERAKHIDIHAHYIRNSVLSSHVSIRHVNSEDNDAKEFTKPLDITKVEKFRSMVGVHPLLL